MHSNSVRYSRAFGYYCNRASVVQDGSWYHLTEQRQRVYSHSFAWTGNYQENLCPVRGRDNRYFHIDHTGNRIYSENYIYCGDFKDGYACVRASNGFYRHIDIKGASLNGKEFLDLGIFHKNFATAKDGDGWFHIDKRGEAIYSDRFSSIEPFYNGFALVETVLGGKAIIDEAGVLVLK